MSITGSTLQSAIFSMKFWFIFGECLHIHTYIRVSILDIESKFNTVGSILVFSLFISVPPSSDSEKPSCHYPQSAYLFNHSPVCSQSSIVAAVPSLVWMASSPAQATQAPSLSSANLPSSPCAGLTSHSEPPSALHPQDTEAYLPLMLALGPNCSETERKGRERERGQRRANRAANNFKKQITANSLSLMSDVFLFPFRI